MSKILDGKIIRDSLAKDLAIIASHFTMQPTLAILQVGERIDSSTYIRQKKLFAEKCGAHIKHSIFKPNITQEELLQEIKKLNTNLQIHGILVQMPLPEHIDRHTVIEAIDPIKDVDGLTSKNTQLLWEGKSGGHLPATARGILELLQYYKIPVQGKNVVIVGKSTLVGKPVACALLNLGATVTICHKQTEHLETHTTRADILIIAIGDREFISKKYVTSGQVVIDVGINPHAEDPKKVVGDVKQYEVENIVKAITPVPGGVGPMTVAGLFQNLFDAYKQL